MNVPFTNINVTRHALARWRDRVSKDDGVRDVIDALQASQFVPKAAHLPIAREARTVYAYNAGLDLYFVLDPITPGRCRVVTIILRENTSEQLVPA